MRFHSIESVSSVARNVPGTGSSIGDQMLGELYVLEYISGMIWEYHAKSDAAAIFLARRKLGLVVTASLDKFKKSGGKKILKKATGLQIYPHTTH